MIWRVIVFMTGVFPVVLGVTGVVMWLRGRQRRKGRGDDVGSVQTGMPQAEAAE